MRHTSRFAPLSRDHHHRRGSLPRRRLYFLPLLFSLAPVAQDLATFLSPPRGYFVFFLRRLYTYLPFNYVPTAASVVRRGGIVRAPIDRARARARARLRCWESGFLLMQFFVCALSDVKSGCAPVESPVYRVDTIIIVT